MLASHNTAVKVMPLVEIKSFEDEEEEMNDSHVHLESQRSTPTLEVEDCIASESSDFDDDGVRLIKSDKV
jgi:hypothetical protein